MRGLKSTLFLVIVLAGLVGYIYYTRDLPPSGTETKPKAFDVLSEDIEELQITNAEGESAHVQRVDDKWKLLGPDEADADADEVNRVTSALASLEIQRVIDESPSDLAQYGLDPPRLDLSFRREGQAEFEELLIGDTTATGSDLYAKKPDASAVFLIYSYLNNTFAKSAFDLRDKAILKFDRDNIDVVEVVGPNPVRFTREGTIWHIAAPIAARADYAAVEGLVTRLSSARMERIVEAEVTDPRQYGLDNPSSRAIVGTGSSRATLLIGREDTNGEVFAKDEARPAVFAIDKGVVTELQKPVSDYRSKDLFDSRSFTANRVELRRGDETQTLEKLTADGEDTWQRAGTDVDSTKVQDLLTKLSGLRAESFESATHTSLADPTLTAVVTFGDDKTETVTFGRAGSDVYASRADEPGSAQVDATAFDEAIAALDALE